jgi:hypothetical protein
MTFWVHSFCKESVADVTADELQRGITKRLRPLTYLFCPEDEEAPDVVLARFRIEQRSAGTWLLRHRNDDAFINISFYGRDALDELETDILPRLKANGLDRVKALLAAATCDVSFALTVSDVRGMGFPLAIAAAATLVARAGGVVQSGSYSWMIPEGNEVKILCEVER